MANLVKILSTSVDSLQRRVAKFFRFGKTVQTSIVAAPYGIDSNPIKDMIAVYSETEEKGKTVLIGYLNKNAKAGPGELRLFSTDGAALEKTYLWLKSDGTIELNGSADNLVRYAALNTALSSELAQINIQLAAISVAIVALGGIYPVTPITLTLAPAKINSVKTSAVG